MEFELVAVATQDGLVIGYAIKKVGLPKLESVNLYTPEEIGEAREFMRDLNDRAALREFWPMPNDPEVQALISNPEFDPIEYDEVDVIDMENSKLVYDMKPGPPQLDPHTGVVESFASDEVKYDEVGQPIINWMASEVAYKKELQPKRTQGKSRIEVASERVARARMEAAHVA